MEGGKEGDTKSRIWQVTEQAAPAGEPVELVGTPPPTEAKSPLLRAIADQKLFRAATHLLSVENQELRQEVEVFIEKEEHRKEKDRQRMTRRRQAQRQANPEELKAQQRKYAREHRARKKQAAESSAEEHDDSERSLN